MTVFLCGFMGCGKSTIGKILARLIGIPFVDMDCYIEKKENMKIPDIFSSKGEQYFRSAETNAVIDLSDSNSIVACGGGAMLNPCNADIARKSGRVIFLDVPFEVCYARIKDDKNRPLVVNNTKEQLRKIYSKRYPVYRAHSSFSVNANASPVETAENIYRLLTN